MNEFSPLCQMQAMLAILLLGYPLRNAMRKVDDNKDNTKFVG